MTQILAVISVITTKLTKKACFGITNQPAIPEKSVSNTL
ncbi:MAG: cyclic lactone autoinducer peptide [Flavobacteriales bacterium]|nr:cyclic lactone autoinducer peptide [Flavobacteriales bacterium]